MLSTKGLFPHFLQMRKLRHKQVKECARGRTARERRGQDLRPGALSAKCALSPAAPRGLLSAGVTVAEGRRKGRDTGGHRGGRGKGGGRWLRRGRRLPKPRGSASSHGTSARRPGPQVRGADTTGEREGKHRGKASSGFFAVIVFQTSGITRR